MKWLTDSSVQARLRRLTGVALIGMLLAIAVGLLSYHQSLMDARTRKTQSLVEAA